MRMYIVVISTEDGERYYLSFASKPSETKIKSLFFKKYGNIYKKKEWKQTIGIEVIEVEVFP
jgi:hypothetical protein